jgi:hypothetical protein
MDVHFDGFDRSWTFALQPNGAAIKATNHRILRVTWGPNVLENNKVDFEYESYREDHFTSGLIDVDGTVTCLPPRSDGRPNTIIPRIQDPPATVLEPAAAQCYLDYCNNPANRDLRNAFCGGVTCSTMQHAELCMNHWIGAGKREGRNGNPETTCLPGTSGGRSTRMFSNDPSFNLPIKPDACFQHPAWGAFICRGIRFAHFRLAYEEGAVGGDSDMAAITRSPGDATIYTPGWKRAWYQIPVIVDDFGAVPLYKYRFNVPRMQTSWFLTLAFARVSDAIVLEFPNYPRKDTLTIKDRTNANIPACTPSVEASTATCFAWTGTDLSVKLIAAYRVGYIGQKV